MRASVFLLAITLAIAQIPFCALAGEVDVPAGGYESTDTLPADDPWMFYNVHVEAGMELVYELRAAGNGTFKVYLSPANDPMNYYISFSAAEPVSQFSGTFPADFGFARDYIIQVNSSAGTDVTYDISIGTQEAPTENYNLYYALIALGFVGLVAFSWKYVVWQDKKEREAGKKEKRGKKQR